MSEKILNWLLSLNWQALIAGFWGASAYAFYKRESLSGWAWAGTLLNGVVVSYYGTKWATWFLSYFLSALFKNTITVDEGPAGFLCGIGGIIAVQGLVEYLTKKKNEYVKTDKPDAPTQS